MNLDDDEKNFEQASDLTTLEVPRVTISNITEDKVGKFEDDATDVGKAITDAAQRNTPATETVSQTEPVDTTTPVDAPETISDEPQTNESDYDDLPF